jgi:hypothetical protein
MMMKSFARPALVLLLAALASVPAAAQSGAAERERAQAERARVSAERARVDAVRARVATQGAMHEAAERRAFDLLLRHRAELALSEQQVRRLQAILARLDQRNAPLRQRLVQQHQHLQAERRAQLERMSAGQRRAELHRLRRARPDVPRSLEPTVRQMRLNIHEAVQQAQAVLTVRQRLRARELARMEVRAVTRTHVHERRVTRDEAARRQREAQSAREAQRQRERARRDEARRP